MSSDDAGGRSPAPGERELRVHVKAELRQRMRKIRRTTPADARAVRSSAIAERVIALEAFEKARVVAAFLSMTGEVELASVVERARELGKTVVLPRVDVARRELVMHVHAPGDRLLVSAFGVSEPLETALRVEPSAIDLVLVPALAVDERGHRIGYGQGFYDRFLPTATRATSVCVAFDFQLVPEAPDLPHDYAVDLVVTDKRVITVGARAR